MLGSLSHARHGSYFYWGYSIDPERRVTYAPTPEGLEAWLRLASSADDAKRELGRRLLARYADPAIAPASWDTAAEWYEKWRERIVFVDSAGFWWLEDPTDSPR